MRANALRRRHHVGLVTRGLLAVLGGYAFCWGMIALCAAVTFPLGAEFHDGETLGSILALLVYPAAFLWAFAARIWLVGAVLVGGGALMAAAASLIQMSVI